MQRHSRRPSTTLLAALAVGLAACSSGNVLGPENQVQVADDTDTFQFQASALDNVKETRTYNWTMTGTSANVNQSGATTGTATLTITDDVGTQVYSKSLTQTGTFQTTAGTAGTWTVTVALDGAGGSVNFRVEKP